ncbi:MAG: VOC family protein [Phycisphaerae bacterium]
MMQVGDIHVFVSDMALALRFWADGLGLRIAEQELTHTTGFAMLEFPDGGPCVRLFSGAEPWAEGQRPMAGSRPTIRFDIATTEFNATLARLLESGGRQLDEIETYSGVRFVTVADPDGNSFELVELPADA